MLDSTRSGPPLRACALAWQGLFESPARAADFAHRGVIFRAQAALALGENVADDPDAVPHVVEDDQAEIKHHHAVVQAHIVAAAAGMRSTSRTMS